MNGGWSPSTMPSVSLADVMSEQLADSLIQNDIVKVKLDHPKIAVSSNNGAALEQFSDETANDEALAQALQKEMDKEYNENLLREEERVNKFAKIKVSLNNYRAGQSTEDYASDESSYSDDDSDDDYDAIKDTGTVQSTNNTGKTIVTKHDEEICNRRNISRMEASFPAGFVSGDLSGPRLQINNKTYNALKKHAIAEERKSQRVHEAKEHRTREQVFDEKTKLLLCRLENNRLLDSINDIISTGKESVVVHAYGGDSTQLRSSKMMKYVRISGHVMPSECAIKIYKTTLNEFRTRDKYIKDDYRFKDRFKRLNPRKIIHMWAEKEMCNLQRMRKANLPCPDPVLLKKHVLVMSFIGSDQGPAPKLKNAVLNNVQWADAYRQVIKIMTTLYHKCDLVHADLSEYNLLWKNETVWVIDVSQAVETHHPYGLEFLYRDCQNISKFFKNLRVLEVADAMVLFNKVSKLNLPTHDETAFKADIERRQRMWEEHANQGQNKIKDLLKEI